MDAGFLFPSRGKCGREDVICGEAAEVKHLSKIRVNNLSRKKNRQKSVVPAGLSDGRLYRYACVSCSCV